MEKTSTALVNVLATLLLLLMAGFLFSSAWLDSATMDELAHIPAGYSYVTLLDLRLNPEHPPLVKALAGLFSRLVKNFSFPADDPLFQNGINEQWNIGSKFLYGSGNNPDILVFSSRVGPIILTLLLGWLIFRWSRKLLGGKWALAVLFLYSFSPNFVGHGHLVTTDIGSTLGSVLGLFYFLEFLKKPERKNIVAASVALGVALLLKFTTLLLVPTFLFLALVWVLIEPGNKLKNLWFWFSRLALIGVAALFVVGLAYQLLITNYPREKQLSDSQFLLRGYQPKIPKETVLWLTKTEPWRGLGYYGLGVVMNLQRSAGGNTAYFLGELSNRGWWYYFPIVYFLKEPIPILILIAISLFWGTAALVSLLRQKLNRKAGLSLATYLRENFVYFAMLAFVGLYWAASVTANLNIGVRHIFPTLPFIWILALKQVKGWTFPALSEPTKNFWGVSRYYLRYFATSSLKVTFLLVLALWYLFEFAKIAPNFLAYFNEFAGGPANGYQYVVDSNLDWGQDLKRLAKFVRENNIQEIKVHYFGGGNPKYFLAERYQELKPEDGPQKGWVAISATFLQGERGRPVLGWDQPCCRYHWLDRYEPVAKIGYSIFVYKIE